MNNRAKEEEKEEQENGKGEVRGEGGGEEEEGVKGREGKCSNPFANKNFYYLSLILDR